MRAYLLRSICIPVLLPYMCGQLPVFAEDWPMWRHDAGRTGISAETLPTEWHLQWTRQLPAVKPAFQSKRLQFDRGYEPIVMENRLFVACPHNDSVVAYSAETGAEDWRFFADGPVRLAPVAWQNKIYFGSDDGYVYSLNADDGSLRWRFRAAPSSRKVLGNGRLISVWAVRGGPVLVDGILYFAAGVWPFEGVFIYALDATTGEVIWMNDRTSFLYGRHPHGAEAMGGLTPQGYLLINGDDLIVPCGTARPAVLDRHTGELKSFSLPGEGRFPGGWFMALDTTESQDARRGKVVFDSQLNREQHEDKLYIGDGSPGIRTRITVDGQAFDYAAGFDDITGEIHTMLAANERLFIVTLDGAIYCFGSETVEPVRYGLPNAAAQQPADEWNIQVDRILKTTGVREGYALVLGTETGRLAQELVAQSELKVIALTESRQIRRELRQRFDAIGIPAERLSVHFLEPADLTRSGLPPYLASLIVAEKWTDTETADGTELIAWMFERLQPHGAIACFNGSDVTPQVAETWVESAQLKNADVVTREGTILVRRVGALPGAVNYTGGWNAPDERVGAPLGILWYDDSLIHFKRAPQPLFINGVMISRDKEWVGEAMQAGPGPQLHLPGTGRFGLTEAKFMDVYTGRILSSDVALPRIGAIPEPLAGDFRPPYQYRPPFVNDEPVPGATNKPALPFHREVARGEMTNPMTGLLERRQFMKSYGCDGGNDYGHLITMRSATAAFYDKRIESGTINISGPRSGCTNSIIPACGLLNIPYFYAGCTCSYPLPVGAALVRMPEDYEQWTAWKGNPIEAPIRRIGINLGAPGDRVTNAGTLWLDFPSVGGPSPEISVNVQPDSTNYFYHHSLWMNEGTGWPWVGASGAKGIAKLQINGLQQGRYTVRLHFVEPECDGPGQRVFNVALQDNVVLEAFDIHEETGGKMRSLVKELLSLEIADHLEIELTAKTGKTVLCGVELVLEGLPLDRLQASPQR